MKYSISILLLLQAAALVTAAAAPETNSDQPDYCVQSQPDLNSTTIPRSYGVVLFRGFQTLDVFGPLDALGFLEGSIRSICI
ncbi:unnamed protein product [Cercospora beticola]|nr:unnamed protein product [Cercospora beticola]